MSRFSAENDSQGNTLAGGRARTPGLCWGQSVPGLSRSGEADDYHGRAQVRWGDRTLEGYAAPDGSLTMTTGYGQKFDGRIDAQQIEGQLVGYCAYSLTWRKQIGLARTHFDWSCPVRDGSAVFPPCRKHGTFSMPDLRLWRWRSGNKSIEQCALGFSSTNTGTRRSHLIGRASFLGDKLMNRGGPARVSKCFRRGTPCIAFFRPEHRQLSAEKRA